jgi:hypothetical protein
MIPFQNRKTQDAFAQAADVAEVKISRFRQTVKKRHFEAL